MRYQSNRQRGFALIASLIIMLVMMVIGLSAVTKGRVLQLTGQTSVRYEAMYEIAEAEMYRLTNALQRTKDIISVGNGVIINSQGEFTQVWQNEVLANQFGTSGLADFSDFRNRGWQASARYGLRQTFTPDSGMIRTSYGTVTTEAFVQRLIQKTLNHGDGSSEVSNQYLITVKAFSQNPGDAADKERETIVLQGLYELSFIR
ncbi:MAG: hypothetical protein CSA45_04305 [Gammaproteobacteria bacterium]|nr:MAG: hypothetical protein CSA45_04305 [Gammaproteobacteria bacterium]